MKLSEEQIEKLVADAHNRVMAVVRVSRDQKVIDAAAHSELRKMFDQGAEDAKHG